ncbi:hypothetical protein FKM82_015362 [Ascaphus truei]
MLSDFLFSGPEEAAVTQPRWSRLRRINAVGGGGSNPEALTTAAQPSLAPAPKPLAVWRIGFADGEPVKDSDSRQWMEISRTWALHPTICY